MVMYDSVFVGCKCGDKVEFQSKAGDCILANYTIDNVPANIVDDLDGNESRCSCGRVLFFNSIVVCKAWITE